MAGIREKIEYNDIPGPFKGSAIVLVTAGLMAMAFFGFLGLMFGGAAGGGIGAICGAVGGAFVGLWLIEARYNE
jgi:hypothetical protein